MLSLAGRTVVVVGGGSSIGFEVARRAAEVVPGGRTAATLEAAAERIGTRWHVLDVTDQD